MAPQIQMWSQNIVYLIGLLLCLAFSGVVLFVLCIALRVHLFQRRQRQSFEAYRKATRRADGKSYPPQTGGICEKCGRVKRVVYHLPSGDKMCHDCYEAWWPIAENWRPSEPSDAEPTPPAA